MQDEYSFCDRVHNMIFFADRASLQIRFANDIAQTITGCNQTTLCTQSLPDLFPELDHSRITALATQLTSVKCIRYEGPFVTAGDRPLLTEAHFCLGTFDETACLVCVVHEILDTRLIEHELDKQRTLYRSLLRVTPHMVCRISSDGTCSEIDLTGPHPMPFDERDIIGKNLKDLFPPDAAQRTLAAIEQVLQTDQMAVFEFHLDAPDGPHEFEARIVASLPNEVLTVLRDITATKHAQTLLRAQRDLGIALSTETNLHRALELVVDTAIRIANMDCGGIYLVDPETGAIDLAYHTGLTDDFVATTAHFTSNSFQAQLIHPGEPVYSRYDELGTPGGGSGAGENLQVVAIVPVKHSNQVIACINVASRSLDVVPALTRHALETIASQIGSAIANIRSKEALRESEETARALLNAPQDTAMLIDTNHTILAINEAGAKRFGQPIDHMVGACSLDFMPPDIIPLRTQTTLDVIRTKKAIQLEDERQGFSFSTVIYPLLNAHQEVTRLAIFARDITEQKQAERALRRRDRLLEAVAQASNHLLATKDHITAINETLRILGKAINVDHAFLFENDPHPVASKLVSSQHYEWLDETFAETTGDVSLKRHPIHISTTMRWYKTLESGSIVGSLVSQLTDAEQHAFAPHNVKTLLFVPLFVNGEFWGAIGFADYHTEREWSNEETQILQLTAASIGAAIERQQTEEKLRHEREMAHTLRDVGMVLTSTLQFSEVLTRILEQARRVLSYDAAAVRLLENKTARVIAHSGHKRMGIAPEVIETLVFHLDQTPVMQKMIQSQQPYISSYVENDPDFPMIPEFEPIKSWIATPIISRDQVVGFLSFSSTEPGFYKQDHLSLITPLARQAAIAFENASLFANVQELEQVKSKMIRMASHDLRSPLTRINQAITQVKELADLPHTAAYAKYCRLIEAATYEMEEIITNILSLDRIEAQYREAKPIVWHEIIAQSVASVQADCDAKQHTLVVECDTDLPVTRGDPVQLIRAVTNLLNNAIKYTLPGGHITIRAYPKLYGDQPTIVVEVEDTGIGISPEKQANLFLPYYRARQTGAEHISGTGLGLSIVKTAVEYHKGNVYCDSVPGEGSVFGFWIPV